MFLILCMIQKSTTWACMSKSINYDDIISYTYLKIKNSVVENEIIVRHIS